MRAMRGVLPFALLGSLLLMLPTAPQPVISCGLVNPAYEKQPHWLTQQLPPSEELPAA
jgi:hypothetical protein